MLCPCISYLPLHCKIYTHCLSLPNFRSSPAGPRQNTAGELSASKAGLDLQRGSSEAQGTTRGQIAGVKRQELSADHAFYRLQTLSPIPNALVNPGLVDYIHRTCGGPIAAPHPTRGGGGAGGHHWLERCLPVNLCTARLPADGNSP